MTTKKNRDSQTSTWNIHQTKPNTHIHPSTPTPLPHFHSYIPTLSRYLHLYTHTHTPCPPLPTQNLYAHASLYYHHICIHTYLIKIAYKSSHIQTHREGTSTEHRQHNIYDSKLDLLNSVQVAIVTPQFGLEITYSVNVLNVFR